MLRLKKLFVICSIAFSFTACLRPEKPIQEVCVVDFPRLEGICGLSGQDANTVVTREPIETLDKATCFRPPEYKKHKDYVDKLEAYIDLLENSGKK